MFGVKNTIFDPRKKENVMLTGGIWWQAGNHYTYNPTVEMTQNDLIDMMRQAFTGNGGNKRKVLIGGSSFIGRINKIEMTKVVMAREDKVQWGIDFSEIKSKFGKLYVLYSEVFDDCGMSDYGFIFDPGVYPEMVSCPVRPAGTRFEKIGGTQCRCVGTDRGQLFDIALSGCSHAYRAGHTR